MGRANIQLVAIPIGWLPDGRGRPAIKVESERQTNLRNRIPKFFCFGFA
jgi:hypothetical protein